MVTYQVKSNYASSFHSTLEAAEEAYEQECRYTEFVVLIKHEPGELDEIICESW